MAISCEPNDLTAAAKCYCGYDKQTAQRVMIYLLAVIANLQNTPPSELAALAKCYCFDDKTAKQVQNYLLCQIANALNP